MTVVAVAAAALAGCGGDDEASSPAALPRAPDRLAKRLADTDTALREAIDRWIAAGPPESGGPPPDVTRLALRQQRIYVLLTDRRRLAARMLAALPPGVRAEARDVLAARRGLSGITPPTKRRRFHTGAALPAGVLLGYYKGAERRYGVGWELLAAVNLVESAFNKLRNDSSAGAQGPMQFIPATWRAYGMGGDVHDPHDAILGAANYLHANGAPRKPARALFAYNRSTAYVDAILRYAHRIRADGRAFYAFYAWQVYVKTPSGPRRITGPGVPTSP